MSSIMIKKYIILIITQLALLCNCMARGNEKVMNFETSLQYVVRESSDRTVNSPMLILLHGHGSNEDDLFSLGKKIPSNWNLVSVRGPYELAKNSYCWYDVKMLNGKIAVNIEQKLESRSKLLQLITDLTKKYNINTSKIIVAGFSQGANMAQALGLSEPNLVSGFGVFSGRFVDEFTPYINYTTELKKSKAFISYGSSDTMLPKSYVDNQISKLKDLGIQITYFEDINGHSISTKQWNEFSKWLLYFK